MPINCKTKVGLIGPAARPTCNVPFPPGFCLPEAGPATIEAQSEDHVLGFACEIHGKHVENTDLFINDRDKRKTSKRRKTAHPAIYYH